MPPELTTMEKPKTAGFVDSTYRNANARRIAEEEAEMAKLDAAQEEGGEPQEEQSESVAMDKLIISLAEGFSHIVGNFHIKFDFDHSHEFSKKDIEEFLEKIRSYCGTGLEDLFAGEHTLEQICEKFVMLFDTMERNVTLRVKNHQKLSKLVAKIMAFPGIIEDAGLEKLASEYILFIGLQALYEDTKPPLHQIDGIKLCKERYDSLFAELGQALHCCNDAGRKCSRF